MTFGRQNSVVLTGLVAMGCKNPGTEVPGYFRCVANGTRQQEQMSGFGPQIALYRASVRRLLKRY
jgi:hypothetical protein